MKTSFAFNTFLLTAVFMVGLGITSGCDSSENNSEDDSEDAGTNQPDTNEDTDSGEEVTVDTDSPEYRSKWESSAHAAATDMAFRYWNFLGHDEIHQECATCHSETGYLDFLGADGSAAGVVDNVVPAQDPPEVVSCSTCHRTTVDALDSVTLPSGEIISDLGPEARCIVCHTGHTSMATIDSQIAGVEDDIVIEGLIFFGENGLHPNGAAGSLKQGTIAKGPCEYAQKTYDGHWAHGTVNTCNSCHDSHSLEVKVDTCTACHSDVATLEDLPNMRMSADDYDGDGDTEEGISSEIIGLYELLYLEIQRYAADTDGVDHIVYSHTVYPYYFADTNQNGVADPDEAAYDEESSSRYSTWTPRLARAAFNYKYARNNPAAYAHNPRYIVQVLIDSMEDLGGDVSGLKRP